MRSHLALFGFLWRPFTRRDLATVCAGLAIGLLSLAPQSARGQAPAAADSLEKLVSAARAEGEVMLYNGAADSVGIAVAGEFEKKYGIKVRLLRLTSPSLLQRFAAEANAGSIVADVLFVGSGAGNFATEGVGKGWVEPITKAGLPVVESGTFPKRFDQPASAIAQIVPWVIAYNTEKIAPQDVPKNWTDVLNPRFREQIIVNEVANEAYVQFWDLMRSRYGDEFLDKIRAQSPRRFDTGVPAAQALAAGEGAIQIPIAGSVIKGLQDKGAPLKVVVPSLTTGTEMHLVLTNRAQAPHPNAGRLLANFMLSPEGNKTMLAGDPTTISIYDYNTNAFPAEYKSPDPTAVTRRDALKARLGF